MKHWKTTLITTALLSLWSVGVLLAAELQGADAKKEMSKFQGKWVLVCGEQEGKKLGEAQICRSQLTFEGEKGQLILPTVAEETIALEIIKIDPTTNPKQLHFVRKNGPHANKTITAIYEFKGEDQFDFSCDPSSNGCPTCFQSQGGSQQIYNTWKRVKQ